MQLWRKYLRIGTHEGLDPGHRKNVIVLNALVAVVIPVQLSLLPLVWYFREFGTTPFVWSSALMLALQGLVLLCSALRKHTLARVIFAFSGLNNILISTILAGTETYAQFLMPAVAIGAFYYFPHEERRLMFVMVGLSVVALVYLEFREGAPVIAIPPAILPTVRSSVIFWFSVITFGFLYYGFVTYRDSEMNLAREREKAENLLRNTLPDEIVTLLKENPRSIADRFESATILFSDIENFTGLSEKLSPDDLVRLLDDIFSRFDVLTDRSGLEKIKTIGDAYMVAAGVPRPRADHCQAMADLALGMMQIFHEARGFGHDLRLRVGMQTGPVVAGVIGKKKFAYDLWGDAVNTASRMESHGIAGQIQVTQAVFDILKHEYAFTARGSIEVKGKGSMPVYILDGKQSG
ncbi:MAG: adenylate/guanylate cyclase domain-containing protein [Spirochaetia bacterium]|nr:adenylate/guanylate cyclase domain-containing protein [Spirochaetia bacterium]